MSLEAVVNDLVLANRVLDLEGVLDGYGHVSVRHPQHPDRFLLSRSRSPALVDAEDIVEFGLDGEPTSPETRSLYIERFIHAGIYARRPEVNAVIHSHAEDLIPFSISPVRLQTVIHSASGLGSAVPVWDIADKFGEDTDLLVKDMDQAGDLADSLSSASLVLMRGHGFVAAEASLLSVVRLAVYAPKNARVQMAAMALGGGFRPLSTGEIASRTFDASQPGKASAYDPSGPAMQRGWDYWRHKVAQVNCICNCQRLKYDR